MKTRLLRRLRKRASNEIFLEEERNIEWVKIKLFEYDLYYYEVIHFSDTVNVDEIIKSTFERMKMDCEMRRRNWILQKVRERKIKKTTKIKRLY